MLIQADARQIPLRDGCVQCVVTSPPYWGLRDYGHDAQIGREAAPAEYAKTLRLVFSEVRRVLADDGVLWLNLGDSYMSQGGNTKQHGPNAQCGNTLAGVTPREGGPREHIDGYKTKDLVGVPWLVAFALRDAGWYLRSDVIWHKPNPMPESVTDRPTKSHEYLFLLTKSEQYYYDADAIAEPASLAMREQMEQGYNGLGLKDYEAAGVQNPSTIKARIIAGARKKQDGHGRRYEGFNERYFSPEAKAARAEYAGKSSDLDSQDASRRMLKNLKEARTATGEHQNPFGLTRNKRTVWTIPTRPYAGAHFATMPEALVEPCILAGSRIGDLVFDPFSGSGTVLAVAERLGRRGVGTDLNPAYHALAKKRTAQRGLRFNQESA